LAFSHWLQWIMFRDWFAKKTAPLTGSPAVRRMKSYSAQSGYAYQYVYLGQRAMAKGAGSEFVFSTSADRKSWHDVSVFVEVSAIREWEQLHERTLSSAEWYAVAKMALFDAFDERTSPAEMWREAVRVRASDVAEIMERLGRD
jgi:hypothetical protein